MTTTQNTTQLGNAINTMDCLSQDGFTTIASMARVALACLRSPDGQQRLNDISSVLMAIAAKAEDIQNCINVEAEGTGFHYRSYTPSNIHH